MAMPYANVPQVFARWVEANSKANSAGLTVTIDPVQMSIKRNDVTWFTSDDLEEIHLALDAYEAALQAIGQ